jgi:hypothetical protein
MRTKSATPADLLPRWRVYQIRKKVELIGSVQAEDEAEAIARAIETYNITNPWKRKRLYARPA